MLLEWIHRWYLLISRSVIAGWVTCGVIFSEEILDVCNTAKARTRRNLVNGLFAPEPDVRRKMLKGCFRLGAEIHLELISGSSRRQSGIPGVHTYCLKADIDYRFPKRRRPAE